MLHLVPLSFEAACEYVALWHRHLDEPAGHKWSTGVADDELVLRGASIIGRPVARKFDDGFTLEVLRVATDGCRNANSMLYAGAWQSAKGRGFTRLITYTDKSESGVSLRAAGWRVVAERPVNRGWNVRSRPRDEDDRCPVCGRGRGLIPRTLWEAQ